MTRKKIKKRSARRLFVSSHTRNKTKNTRKVSKTKSTRNSFLFSNIYLFRIEIGNLSISYLHKFECRICFLIAIRWPGYAQRITASCSPVSCSVSYFIVPSSYSFFLFRFRCFRFPFRSFFFLLELA